MITNTAEGIKKKQNSSRIGLGETEDKTKSNKLRFALVSEQSY